MKVGTRAGVGESEGKYIGGEGDKTGSGQLFLLSTADTTLLRA